MARNLSPERIQLKEQAKVLRKMGWTQQAIAEQTGVPRRTIRDWFGGNSKATITAKRGAFGGNSKATITAKPTFLSWCGRIEDFQPEGGIRFDLIIADPPWNVSMPKSEISRKARRTSVKKDFGLWDSYASENAYLLAVKQWLRKLHKLANTPSWCWFWCSYRYLSFIAKLAESSGWDVHNWFIWTKTNPAPLMGANNFLQAVEPMLVMRKGSARFRFDNGHLPNFFTSPQVATSERIKDLNGNTINLAQKPVPLLSLIITWCTEPGQWVLDAFSGSGSTSVAALKNGRNTYAIDTDKAQLTILRGRLERGHLI